MSNFGMKETADKKKFVSFSSATTFRVFMFLSQSFSAVHADCKDQKKFTLEKWVNVYDDDGDGDDAKKTVGITTIFIEF